MMKIIISFPILTYLTLSSILQFATKRPSNKELSSSNSSLSSTSETANESTSPNTPEAAPRARRRVRQNDTIDCTLSNGSTSRRLNLN